MLFTWDTTNLCIVFKQWHIRSTPGLIISLLAVVLIAMGYEGLRATCRMYEKSMEARVDSAPSESCSPSHVPSPLLCAAIPILPRSIARCVSSAFIYAKNAVIHVESHVL